MADFTYPRARQYKDFSLSFGSNPVTHDIVTVIDADAVKRSIKTLVLTMAGEVPFFPKFGSTVNQLLFEPIDTITTTLLENSLRQTITDYEPRVRLNRILVTPSADELTYTVDIEFIIVNQTEPVTLSIFLSRLR